jgi:hypothetical protein
MYSCKAEHSHELSFPQGAIFSNGEYSYTADRRVSPGAGEGMVCWAESEVEALLLKPRPHMSMRVSVPICL